MSEVEELDVRTIEPRERHPKIFGMLTALPAGETLRLVNDHDPIPLRYQLEAEYPDQYDWTKVEDGPERWMVDITSRVRLFDARPVIAAGEEPFAQIMSAASSTGTDEVLVVLAPFEPNPLIEKLSEQGFSHNTRQVADDTWRVRFARR